MAKFHFPKIKLPKSVGHTFTKLGETAEVGFGKATKDMEKIALAPTNLLNAFSSGKPSLMIPLLIGGCVVAYIVLKK